MTKRTIFLTSIIFFLLVGVISPLAGQAFFGPGPTSSASAPDANAIIPASGANGFYIANSQWDMLPPSGYSAVGTFHFWSWESLNPAPNLYRFDKIDSYISTARDEGYQKVGIAIATYQGRYVQRYPCGSEFNQGYALTPYFVRWGPDGIEGTADDPVVIADEPDARDCDGDGNPDPWLLPKYTDPYYKAQYQQFIEAMADYLLNSPNRDHVAWVAIGSGKDGENIPVDNGSDDDSLLRVISVDDWVNFVKFTIDIYHDAFSANAGKPQINLLSQNAPFYRYTWERREIAAYANSKDVGVSVNNITSDFDLTEAGAAGNYIGLYDQIRQYHTSVPIGLESYGYMMASENEFYWAMARAIDLKPDFLRLSYFWDLYDTSTNRIIAQWASRFIGRGFEPGQNPPPSIWSRMREHRDPLYLPYVADPAPGYYWPTLGNYEYFLRQDFEAPNGVTIPLTDDIRFQASDHRFGTDQYPDVRSQPWHYNEHGYDAVLNSVGLYHVESVKQGAVEVQIQVDPGWTARRSNQSEGSYGFFFDADDRYLSAPTDINDPHEVRITVTYLDHGNDRWRLMYDSTSGQKAATLYALQDWDVRTGLALDDGLPNSGVLPDPKPAYVQKTNTNRWKVATFYIQDGYFDNRLPGDNDFYIDSRSDSGSMDGDEYIHHVDVQRLNDIPQVTPTPTPPGSTPTPTPTPTATPGAEEGSISGYVFESLDGDFTKDPDEPGLPGALVRLHLVSDLSNPVAETVSDDEGFYSFTDLSPETYVIIVSPPAGWEMILASRYIVLEAGQSLTHQDFPARLVATLTPTPTPTLTPSPTPTPVPTGQLDAFVWHDLDQDGRHDADEPPLADAVAIIFDSTGQTELARQLTDSDGYARFTLPAPMDYVIKEIPPPGGISTTPSEFSVKLYVDTSIEVPFGNFIYPFPLYLPLLTAPSS